MAHHHWISPFGFAGFIIGLVLLTACSPLVTEDTTTNTNQQVALVQEVALSVTPLPTSIPPKATPKTHSPEPTSTSIPPVEPKLVSVKVNAKEVLPGEEAPWYGRGNTITEICLTNVGSALDYQIALPDGTVIYKGRLTLSGEQACAAFDFSKTPTLHPFLNNNNNGKVNMIFGIKIIGELNYKVVVKLKESNDESGGEENTPSSDPPPPPDTPEG